VELPAEWEDVSEGGFVIEDCGLRAVLAVHPGWKLHLLLRLLNIVVPGVGPVWLQRVVPSVAELKGAVRIFCCRTEVPANPALLCGGGLDDWCSKVIYGTHLCRPAEYRQIWPTGSHARQLL